MQETRGVVDVQKYGQWIFFRAEYVTNVKRRSAGPTVIFQLCVLLAGDLKCQSVFQNDFVAQ